MRGDGLGREMRGCIVPIDELDTNKAKPWKKALAEKITNMTDISQLIMEIMTEKDPDRKDLLLRDHKAAIERTEREAVFKRRYVFKDAYVMLMETKVAFNGHMFGIYYPKDSDIDPTYGCWSITPLTPYQGKLHQEDRYEAKDEVYSWTVKAGGQYLVEWNHIDPFIISRFMDNSFSKDESDAIVYTSRGEAMQMYAKVHSVLGFAHVERSIKNPSDELE